MGLRCLLGHEYANREVEREREERGNEVVVTYRTVETCDRCGERRVVSENKEVRPVRNPADETVSTGLGGDGSVTPDLGEEADTPSTPDTEPTAAAGSEADPSTADTTATESADTAPDPTVDDTPSDPVDNGIILDDDDTADDTGERGRGEWPDADDAEADETVDAPEPDSEPDADPEVDDGATVVTGEGWPEPDGEDEGFDAEPDDGDSMDVSFGGGLTPETEATSDESEESAVAATSASGSGSKQFVTAEGVERVDDDDDGETEFFCPNCGYARVAGGSSMRAGDICPDCHKGYIGERER